jgi:hypothetical protein
MFENRYHLMQRENKNVILDWRLPLDVVSDSGPGM